MSVFSTKIFVVLSYLGRLSRALSSETPSEHSIIYCFACSSDMSCVVAFQKSTVSREKSFLFFSNFHIYGSDSNVLATVVPTPMIRLPLSLYEAILVKTFGESHICSAWIW